MGQGEDPGEVTRLLERMSAGDGGAERELLPLVYEQLKRVAIALFQQERAGHTLQPTALAHEAYLRLIDQKHADWKGD